jgi:hypothetical protein
MVAAIMMPMPSTVMPVLGARYGRRRKRKRGSGAGSQQDFSHEYSSCDFNGRGDETFMRTVLFAGETLNLVHESDAQPTTRNPPDGPAGSFSFMPIRKRKASVVVVAADIDAYVAPANLGPDAADLVAVILVQIGRRGFVVVRPAEAE